MANGYGKRPMWQWVLLYVVVGGIIYFLIYYFVIAKHGGYNSGNSGYSIPSQSNQAPSNNSGY